MKLKIESRHAIALWKCYQDIFHIMEPGSKYENLIYELNKEILQKLDDKIPSNSSHVKFELSPSHAFAFIEFWKRMPVVRASDEHLATLEVIALIDKQHKNAKALQHG